MCRDIPFLVFWLLTANEVGAAELGITFLAKC
jgi:hypothetical protein